MKNRFKLRHWGPFTLCTIMVSYYLLSKRIDYIKEFNLMTELLGILIGLFIGVYSTDIKDKQLRPFWGLLCHITRM